jgi:phage-related baseplate assembly protein
MLVDMSHKTFLLTRATGAEMIAALLGALLTMFAPTAACNPTFTRLVTKEDGAIRDYLHFDGIAVAGNPHLALTQAIGASPDVTGLHDHDVAVEAATAVSGQGVDFASNGIANPDLFPVVIRSHAQNPRRPVTGTTLYHCAARTVEAATMHVDSELVGAR